MTDQQHPITPPPELVKEWWGDSDGTLQFLADKAARWGYRQCDAEYERAAMEIVPPTWLKDDDLDSTSSSGKPND